MPDTATGGRVSPGESHAGTYKITRRCSGWARGLADDVDPVMVDRLVRGDKPVGYTTYERREAVRRLRQQHLSQREIATRLSIHSRQVCRDLEHLGLAADGLVTGWKARAAERRRLVERLLNAGCRVSETACLLGVSRYRVSADRAALGVPARDLRTHGRSRAELLATYGHLLHELEEASA